MKITKWFWNKVYKIAQSKISKLGMKTDYVSFIDPVTNTRNFTKFKMDVTKLFQKYPHEKFALFYSDIKNFKYINDVYGFEIGNQVLKRFSNLLAIEGKISFARINADNFVSIERYANEKVLLECCEKRIQRVSDVSGIIETMPTLTLFVGAYCTHGNNNEMSIDAMIDRANIARRQLKDIQSGGCIIYDEKFRQNMFEEQQMENRMNEALLNHEFVVYLQPKFNISKNKIAAAEALVRWKDPKKGLLSPSKFIPLFEQNGFIKQLDKYMFTQVCILIRKWIDNSLEIIPISVNVSKVQLNNPTFLQDYINIKEKYQIPDGLIEIEFTESMLFDNSERMAEVLEFFRFHGFRSSIDDFGSGYSSLNLLKNLPADILKLDKVFFEENEYKEREKVIIKNVISMAKELSMQTVAEGVERIEQLEFLKSVDCELVQGYVFDKPMSADEFEGKYIM